MKNIYIDIDGVLLTKRHIKSAEDASEFISFITENFNCYWLTTHCKGKSETALRYLRQFLPGEDIKKLELVKPTNWDTLKTEGINFEQDFYWLEDAPMRAEINVLNKNHCNQKIIIVDLSKENELRNVMEFLNLARSFLT